MAPIMPTRRGRGTDDKLQLLKKRVSCANGAKGVRSVSRSFVSLVYFDVLFPMIMYCMSHLLGALFPF